jgi:hypothetical protein
MYKIQSKIYGFPLFVEDDLFLLLLPCFFSNVLVKRECIFKVVEREDKNGEVHSELEEKDVDQDTIKVIFNRLETFMEWVENYSQESKHVSLSTHHNLPSVNINSYINDFLIKEQARGKNSIAQHLMALNG